MKDQPVCFACRVLVALSILSIQATAIIAQDAYDMGKMQLVFLTRSPEWQEGRSEQISKEHRAHVEKLIKEGRLALWGAVTGESGLQEILVFKIDSFEEAQQLAQALPAVQAGMMKADALSWYAARKLITAPQLPLAPSPYVFGTLVRGPKATKEQTEESKKIQEGHMANINRLAKTGKLVLAGPFYGDGDRRGVFIFKDTSLEEAQALTNTDPAVIAGKLKIELHAWSVPKGMLP